MSPTDNLSMTSDHRLVQSVDKGGKVTKVDLVVAQDGSGDFSTVSKAIEASKNRRTGTDKFVIFVKSGVYVESVIVNSTMPNLTLIGEGIDATVITNNKNANDGYETYNTATFQIWGSGFVAAGITFENTAGPEKLQAVALLSASDLSAFFRCSFKGYQDTLCLLQHRQFYRECDIYGTVDFIFGDATAVLQECNIYFRKPLPGQQNTITAQGRTDSSSVTGFVIHKSRVTAAAELTLANGWVRNFLGRPWRDYSTVVFVKCYLDSLIDPQGWLPYRGSSAFDKLYYAEYMNSGEGANTTGRVKWPGFHVLTSDQEAEQFSVGSFLAGDSWIPQTGIPFYSGI
ncbi:probable pectinesterase/pectinesterase inhibitor 6 [Lactuca sativa]|uniref:probable pectinesterase/pectinesterase inhibitor 6 n=1 Tax=Lactuca sativa TaxID=4236 RepID=UPI000CD85F84|nr:probable pectinesterase/pectinesterase inhibitor 6 [Lactuca sativa]